MRTDTCKYCTNRAKHNLILLKNQEGKPDRIVTPHCGCDILAAIRNVAPLPHLSQIRLTEGVDYLIEPFPEEMHHMVTGDGVNVSIQLRNSEGRFVSFTIPKQAARKLAQDVREASNRPEPGCTDADDHWRGHCRCK